MGPIHRLGERVVYLVRIWRPDPLERLQREIDFSVEHGLAEGTRHDTLLALRNRTCGYAPRNGGRGRQPGEPRWFGDYVQDVLGPDWGDDEAAAVFVANRDAARMRCDDCGWPLTRETAVPAGIEGHEYEVSHCDFHARQ